MLREEDLDKLVKYLDRPRSVEEVMEEFEISERSAYRYFKVLEDLGNRVARFGTCPTRYQVIQ